jgi:predicted MFS family arabinose efflux permease
MERRLVAWVVVAVGAVLLVVSALADSLGIGDEDGFGWKQTTGVVVGAAVLVGGLAWMYMPRRGEVEAGAEE